MILPFDLAVARGAREMLLEDVLNVIDLQAEVGPFGHVSFVVEQNFVGFSKLAVRDGDWETDLPIDERPHARTGLLVCHDGLHYQVQSIPFPPRPQDSA